MRVPFTKLQALRNDFVLVDGRSVPVADPSTLARFLCDRKSGVGADTLLLLLPSDEADVCVRIFNPDGSEGEMSGNGTRCVAVHFLRWEERRGADATVETAAGVSRHTVKDRRGKRSHVASRILAPRFRPAEIPVLVEGRGGEEIELVLPRGSVRVTCANIGNPQAVLFEGWDETNWTELGAAIEKHPLFPERTNVDFARVVAEDRLDVRLWERGVGPVESSGTGASGAFAAARRRGFVSARVSVRMEGGLLELEETEEGLLLEGWCEEVFTGEIDAGPGEGV